MALTVLNPCSHATWNNWEIEPTLELKSTLPTNIMFTIPKEPQDSVSLQYGTQDGYSFCGPRKLIITDASTMKEVTEYSYNNETGIVEFALPSGNYTFKVYFTLWNY
jgi:hypothetical protein